MPTLEGEAEGPIRGTDIARCLEIPRGHRPRARTEAPCMGTGRSRVHPRRNMSGDASGSLRTHADDERTRYYGVPTNRAARYTFRFQVGRLWHRTLCGAAKKPECFGPGCGA